MYRVTFVKKFMNDYLVIECRLDQGRVSELHIFPRSLLSIPTLLTGKTPDQALRTIATLFGLCRFGQCYAASEALARVTETPLASGWRLLLRSLRDLEMVREHCLNLLRLPNWPLANDRLAADLLTVCRNLSSALTGGHVTPAFLTDGSLNFVDIAGVLEYQNKLTRIVVDLLGKEWLKPLCSDFSSLMSQPIPTSLYLSKILSEGVADWGRSPMMRLSAPLAVDELSALLHSEQAKHFTTRPTWGGLTYETTGYNRQYRHPLLIRLTENYGNGLLPRIAGRCLEIGSLMSGLQRSLNVLTANPEIVKPSSRAENGWGIAQVRTARGLLIHAVQLAEGQIMTYHMIAPTEWNFHPEGLLPTVLTGQRVTNKDEFRRHLTTFLYAIDPCVDFELRLTQA
jgi:hypothetical protein